MDSSQQLYAHIEQTPLAFIEWDLDFRVIVWNRSAEIVFGYSSDEAIGEHASFIVPEKARKHVDGVWQQLLAQSGGSRSQNLNLTKSGKSIFCEWYNSILRNSKGELIGIASLVLDITENNRIRNDLLETEETVQFNQIRYEALFNHIADPIVIFDFESYKFLDCNQSAIKKYGYTKEEFYQLTPHNLHPAEELKKVDENISDESRTAPNEYTHITKEGSSFAVEIHTQETSFRKQKAWISIIRDITDRKKSELELKLAKEKAEESDRLKSAFLANMSHEIRTPMNAILGFTDLLSDIDTMTVAERDMSLKVIQNSGERLMSLINDLIDISKIEAGEIQLYLSEIKVHYLCDELFNQFKMEAEKRNLKLVYIPNEKERELFIHSDRNRVIQVLTNLIKNALKFTPKGSVSFGYLAEEEGVEIFVEDTGIGIREEEQDLIFERFRQAYSLKVSETEGTGLGLSISKALVKRVGGDIGLKSAYGKGTRFSFTLPRRLEG